MKNNNQTPVEWLIEEIENRDKIIDSETDDLVRGSMISYGYGDLHEQAKEMENQKDAKYNEMLEMLEKLVSEFSHYTEMAQGTSKCGAILEAKELIKEATQI
jgi:hypothetical protein